LLECLVAVLNECQFSKHSGQRQFTKSPASERKLWDATLMTEARIHCGDGINDTQNHIAVEPLHGHS
jgi:hypothetical protein